MKTIMTARFDVRLRSRIQSRTADNNQQQNWRGPSNIEKRHYQQGTHHFQIIQNQY